MTEFIRGGVLCEQSGLRQRLIAIVVRWVDARKPNKE
jgi:hypothetical protein